MGCFVDCFDGDGIDVSLLLILLIGMFDVFDLCVVVMVVVIECELVDDGLLFCYWLLCFVDGCEGDEGVFFVVGFWFV